MKAKTIKNLVVYGFAGCLAVLALLNILWRNYVASVVCSSTAASLSTMG